MFLAFFAFVAVAGVVVAVWFACWWLFAVVAFNVVWFVCCSCF